jgi:beta-glucosidase
VTITGASGSLTHSTTATITVIANAAVAQIINQMTLSNDLTELHGIQDANDYRVVPGIATLGIPLLNITNGPAGATNGGPGHQGSATALPAPIAVAATWDINLAKQYGTIIGAESKAWANGLLEGLDINIARVPQNGRTFEAFGEDPYLVSQIAVANLPACSRRASSPSPNISPPIIRRPLAPLSTKLLMNALCAKFICRPSKPP